MLTRENKEMSSSLEVILIHDERLEIVVITFESLGIQLHHKVFFFISAHHEATPRTSFWH